MTKKRGTQKGNTYFPFTGWEDEGHGYHRYYIYDHHFGTVVPSLFGGRSTGYRDNVIAAHTNAKDFATVDEAKKHVEQLAVAVVGA